MIDWDDPGWTNQNPSLLSWSQSETISSSLGPFLFLPNKIIQIFFSLLHWGSEPIIGGQSEPRGSPAEQQEQGGGSPKALFFDA